MNDKIKTALITGASAGIGRAFADALHKEGYRVILTARRAEVLNQMTQLYNSLRADSAEYYPLNLAQLGDIKKLEDVISKTEVSLLVANAGRGSFGAYENLSIDDETEMVLLNVVASLRSVHAVVPQMKTRHSGSIIIVSSIAAFQPLPFMSTYGATKAFNFSQALGLHEELRPYGIKVLAVCPGPTETEFGGVARVPGTATGIRRDSAMDVVKESLLALARGVPIVVTGMRSKMLVALTKIVPVRISTWLVGRQLRPLIHHGAYSPR